jgi:hypothetical protein
MPLELAEAQQPGFAGELARRWREDDRRAAEVRDLGPAGW